MHIAQRGPAATGHRQPTGTRKDAPRSTAGLRALLTVPRGMLIRTVKIFRVG